MILFSLGMGGKYNGKYGIFSKSTWLFILKSIGGGGYTNLPGNSRYFSKISNSVFYDTQI